MNILLDTHVLLWVIQNDIKLPKPIRATIQAADRVFVSVVSLWECAIKISIHKLEIELQAIFNAIEDAGFELLPIRAPHLQKLLQLPLHHKDPFDRLLIAQAMSEPLILQSADEVVLHYFAYHLSN